jgi:hypothetical protein
MSPIPGDNSTFQTFRAGPVASLAEFPERWAWIGLANERRSVSARCARVS